MEPNEPIFIELIAGEKRRLHYGIEEIELAETMHEDKPIGLLIASIFSVKILTTLVWVGVKRFYPVKREVIQKEVMAYFERGGEYMPLAKLLVKAMRQNPLVDRIAKEGDEIAAKDEADKAKEADGSKAGAPGEPQAGA